MAGQEIVATIVAAAILVSIFSFIGKPIRRRRTISHYEQTLASGSRDPKAKFQALGLQNTVRALIYVIIFLIILIILK